jgi:peptide-methionine (R)-S-oxide reductase
MDIKISWRLCGPVSLAFILFSMCACTEPKEVVMGEFPIGKTDAEWKEELTQEQYRILRKAGTERAFSGIYTDLDASGVYRCAGCGAELFTSDNKYHSGCGWPAFDDVLDEKKVIKRHDLSHGMDRIEVLCASCGGHLGHLFDDGPSETTGLRYCINSVALEFGQASESGVADAGSEDGED